jgi:D-glycero-D-manno-heptose 1,7-bisphosphate phosphatase
MVGDKPSDVETGRRAGCTTVLLALRGEEPSDDADHVARSWDDVTAAILQHEAGAA